MNLHWGGEYLDKVLSPELKARLRECNCDPFYDQVDNTYTVCNGKTGEVILAMQGVMPRRVSRRKLKALLSEGIDIQVCGAVLGGLQPTESCDSTGESWCPFNKNFRVGSLRASRAVSRRLAPT